MKESEIIKLAVATVTPFDPRGRGATLPIGSCPSSHKASGVIRLDGVLNSSGNGMIMVNPSPYADANCLWYSGNSTFSSATFNNSLDDPTLKSFDNDPVYRDSGMLAAHCNNLPFNVSEAFTPDSIGTSSGPPGVRGRIISCGVKVTFSGTTLADGGVAYALVEPNHENLFGQSVNSLLSKYTSTKVQRLALRKDVELTLFPVSENQKDYSNALDDVKNGYGLGLNSRGGHIAHTANSLQNVDPISYTSRFALPIDSVDSARAASTVVYPLSRRNQNVTRVTWYSGSGGTTLFTIASIDTLGVITWGGIGPPPTSLCGALFTFCTTDTHPIEYSASIPITYEPASAAWYAGATGGGPWAISICADSTDIVGEISFISVDPSIIGAIAINAGTAMAGQTFHVEYIVHCEYTGLNVQGRTTHNVPDVVHTNLVHAIVHHARDSSGQDEKSTVLQKVAGAALDIAGKEAPHLVDGLVSALCPELAAVVNPLINTGLSEGFAYLTRSVKRRRFF